MKSNTINNQTKIATSGDAKNFWPHQSKETNEDFFQMKMNPLLALILWVPKSEIFGVQAQPELSYFVFLPSPLE